MRIALLVSVTVILLNKLDVVCGSWLMRQYEETYTTHARDFERRFGPHLIPAPVDEQGGLHLGAPSKVFRSLTARMLEPPWRVNYRLMKTEMKWTTAKMYSDFITSLHPSRVLDQDVTVLRQYLRRYTQIATHFDRHRAGLSTTTAHRLIGPAAGLNDNEEVFNYEAVFDNSEILLRDAVDLHASQFPSK